MKHKTVGDGSSVSVVIPAYNCGAYLDATIQSVRRQLLPAHEVIVVDDGSTDSTDKIVSRYRREVTYHRQYNQGASAARNTGASLASGEWIMFLDADDKLTPNALADLTASVGHKLYGVVYGAIVEKDAKTGGCSARGDGRAAGPPPVPARASFWKSAIVAPGAAIVRRKLHELCGGFDANLPAAEDRDYWLRCGMLETFGYCPEVVCEKTARPDAASRNLGRNLIGGVTVQIKFLDWCRSQGLEPPWR